MLQSPELHNLAFFLVWHLFRSGVPMLRNYFKIGLRNLWRFKVYSLINVFGLALGLTVTVLIMLFVIDEVSFDQFHEKKDRLYKIVTISEGGGMETNSWPVARILATEYPEVERTVYTRRAGASMLINHEGKRFEHELFYAGNEFFEMFSFTFLEGNPEEALENPFSIVLTQSLKEAYFPNQPALGSTLLLQDSLEFSVTGVIEDIPARSHIQFEGLLSFATFERLNPSFSYSSTDGWGNFNVRNYLLLKEGTDREAFQNKVRDLYRDRIGELMDQYGVNFSLGLIPLSEVYLKSEVSNGFGPKGSLDRVYLVSAIAFFVLLLACINYINLSTARSVYRAREVGMRKIVGSSRRAIFWQFQIEVLLITLVSFSLVALFLDLILPFFNSLMGKSYEIAALLSPEMLLGIVILVLLIAFFSGFYPSRVLSRFQPAEVLKSRIGSARQGINLRRGLVIVQFAVSGALLMATFVVIGQLKYVQESDLGFEKEQVLVFDITRVPSANQQVFANGLREISMVKQVTLTNALPGRPGWLGQWAYAGDQGENAPQVDTEYMAIDENYLEVLGLELIAGRNFDPQRQSDIDDGLIINETTVREMDWLTPENAIGKRIVSPSSTPAGEVIGVVRDYHGLGLQENIWPMAMDYSPERSRYVAVKFATGQTSALMQQTEEIWKNTFGDYTREYFFLDEEFDKQYRSEERLMQVFILFAVLTVIIAGIGLLGLVSFMVTSRTREIGIRKVMGANEAMIVRLLSREFMLLVLLANVLIIPLVWWIAQNWLNEFAYHGPVNPMVFLITLLFTGVLALTVVGVQTFIAARKNPVETLRAN